MNQVKASLFPAAPLRRSGRLYLFLGWLGVVLAGNAQQAPDLTNTNLALINTANNYNLGPTGLRGWIYVGRDNKVGPDGRGYSRGVDESMTDCQPYQVLVVAVGTNTPAAGIIQTNDVLLGVTTGSNNVPVPLFTNDTRRAIGVAIGQAEAGDGWMNFKVWRAGVTNDVAIRLPLRGLAYSATAPFNCPKSAVILSNAVNVLASRPLNYSSLGNSIVGLAMLASGNTNFAPTLQSYAQSITAPSPGEWFWYVGYRAVFLAEYYLKTGDTNVLPRLASLALYCANGQDRYGTMCHGPGYNNSDGSPNGTAGGYGPVNAVGITANLAVVMAQKCLVAAGQPVDPAIPAAITRGTNFFGWFVQKGEIQYGEHLPWGAGSHASNGKHGGAALLFAMTGDRPVETEYWTRMSLAGYLGREYGHTGQGLSYLWEALGVNVGGTNALIAYASNILWHLDLERRSDGSFVYDGAEQYGPSAVSDYWAVGGNNTYAGEDPTAYYVLTYALPLQQIYLTGRNANPTNVLTTAKITNALAAAVIPMACTNFTTNQLIAALSDYDPNVRCWSALELGRRASVSVATLTNLAASTNAWTRAAACVALGQMQPTNGFPALVQCLSDTDISVRAHAATALKKCGAAITNYIPAMLAAYTNNATDPTVINWNDPWQGANEVLASVLWGGWILTSGVGNDNLVPYTASASRTLLYPALRAGLKHPDSLSRGDAAGFINQRLSQTDIQVLAQSLIECATSPVLADPMWRSDGRSQSIQALAKYYNAEAVTIALAMQNPPWVALGQGDGLEDASANAALNSLKTYGDSVRWTLPTLNNYVTAWGPSSGRYSTLVSAINTITAATNAPTITNVYPVALSKVVPTTNAAAITLTGTSCRTNAVSFLNVTAPANGVLSGTAPNLTYTPNPGFTGVDRFTFQTADSLTNSDPATVSLIVGAAGGGVSGQYFDNADFTNLKFSRTDPQINFDWGIGSPSNSIAADTFSVRWSGLLLAPESGNYMFSSLNSDGVRFYLNGSLLIDDWTDQNRSWTDGGSIYLTAGQQYSVQMDYYENTGDAAAKLKWSGPSFGGSNGVLIAKEWLFTGTGATNLPVFAYAQSVTLLQNSNAAITLTATPNGTNYQIITPPANGALSGTPPLVTYTPNINFSGTDSFTFTASSATVTSAPATVSLNILAGTPTAFVWKNSVSSNWNFAANWTNAVAPAATGQPFYSLNFTPTGTYSVTNNLNAGFAANQLNFAGAVTLNGNSLTTTTNGPLLPQFNQNSANAVVVNPPLALAAMTTLGGIGGGKVTFSSLVSGPGGLTINSPGTLQLNLLTNTYSGGTIINAGTVQGPSGGGNPTPFLGTGPITINSAATLVFDRNTFPNSINLNGGTVTGGNSFRSYFTGPVTVSNVTTVNLGYTGGFEISGNVSGSGGFTSGGTITWYLSGTNTYTGPTIIQAGGVSYSKSVSLPPGPLCISNAAVANLNYTGNRTNNWLILAGTNQPAGTYGSLTSTATNKSAFFTGTGILTVAPNGGTITNQAATGITTSAANLNAAFTGTGIPATIIACWGPTNAGTNTAAWANTAVIGAWNLQGATNLTYAVAGLVADTQYYFTFRFTNSLQTVWAPNVLSFIATPPGANAYLADLTPSSAALTPAFGPFTYGYTAAVPYATTGLALTPTAFDTNATIRVNGTVVSSGATSPTNSLAVGANTLNTVVASANASVTNTYAVTVTRLAASTNALLTALVPSSGSLSPAFTSNGFNYTVNVPCDVNSVTLTPMTFDPTSSVTVNGLPVTSGSASGPISLNYGPNAVTVVVVAQNQSTACSYNVVVMRVGPPYATGGDIITNSGRYRIHTFTNLGNATFTPTNIGNVEVLIVGGGGGGGKYGGGGGGGGVVYTNGWTLVGGSNYLVTVGAGGNGSTTSFNNGTNGLNSVFGSLIAYGGGGGGARNSGNGPQTGAAGGSGGGGSPSDSGASTGGAGTAGQGNNGGNAPGGSSGWGGAGGGGAGAAGSNATGNGASANGGAGGAGVANSITGSSVTYAGGGGGCTYSASSGGTVGAGGAGGGGAGGKNASGVKGTASTGGGGGGGDLNTGQNGGNGGSGIVIVRYLIPADYIVAGSLAVTNATASSATLNANLQVPNTNANLIVYWGLTNGAYNPSAWANSALVGRWTNTITTNVSLAVSGLAPGTNYFYTFRATNALQDVWATNTLIFSTVPAADFSAAPTNGYAPLRVVFADTSAGSITNRSWNFGDGNTFSTAAQTTVTNLYANPGVYPVTLTVSGLGGPATNLQASLITVAAVPAPVLRGANAFTMSPAGAVSINFTALAGVQYRLVQRTNLFPPNGTWTAVTPPLPAGWTNGSGAVINLTDPAGGDQRFYRLEAKSLAAP